MKEYVDGFVLPLPKDAVEKYRGIASQAAAIWREYGALEYRECILEDANAHDMVGFPALAGTKEGETVVFAWIVYKSREHRDEVNAKVMADPRMNEMMEDGCPFDCKRMAYGGFGTLVKA
jgi:uncharacterized protein YbaA (DUF1428 family)